MGLFDIFKGQFIDIVEWADETPGVLVHRFERHNNEIKNNAKLVVRPGQAAVFVNEGKVADHFGPGTYTLSTANVPILTSLLSLPTGFVSWHKAEVYFVKTTEQLDLRWGTSQPVMMRDPDFGIIRFRAFGNYSYRIGMTDNMLERFVGAKSEFMAEDLQNQMGTKIISELSDSIGELKIPALDLLSQYNEISERVLLNLKPTLAGMGIEIMSFTVENINLPEEVNKAIDKRGAVGALGGVMNQYAQMQAADAMLAAANNQGGSGNVMGMMVGGQLGGMMGQNMMQPQQVPQAPPAPQAPPPPPPPPAAPEYFVAVNGQRQGPYTVQALAGMAMNGTFNGNSMVWTAGMATWQAASTVSALNSVLSQVPPPIP